MIPCEKSEVLFWFYSDLGDFGPASDSVNGIFADLQVGMVMGMGTLGVSLVVFLFPLAWSPGPGNLFFATSGARFGVFATLPASLGYHLAKWCVSLAIGFGAVAILAPGSVGFDVLKLFGALFIFCMALRMIWNKPPMIRLTDTQAGVVVGAMLLLCNPKAHVITFLMFAQFPVAQDDPMAVQKIFYIATVFTLNNLVAFSVWTWMGDRVFKTYRTSTLPEVIQPVFGVCLIGVAGWMLV